MDPLAALLNEQPPQLLSASELQSRLTLLEGATRACRAELESHPSWSRVGTPMDALPNEIRQHIFSQLCNVLEPRDAVDFSSASQELRALTPALLQQLRADHVSMRGIVHPWLGQIRLKRNGFKTLFKS